jgi:hypothetical protein
MVKPLLDEQTNNPIRVEDEVGTFRVLIPDFPASDSIVSRLRLMQSHAVCKSRF